ncbi:MAG: branched-chain amino acid ABC transporter permease [Mesorhizobium sp.]
MNSGTFHSLRSSLPTATLLLLVLGVIYAVTEMIGSPVLSQFVIRMYIYLILVVGLQIFMGNSNILWFPHVAFMGIGAYISSICSMEPFQKSISLTSLYPFLADIHLPFLPSLLVGALVAAIVAGILGLPLMRLSDFPVVITSFALLIILHVVMTNWHALTNGPQTFFGVDQFTDLKTAAVWAAIVVVIACVFRESKVGLQLRASRDDSISAGAIGIDLIKVRWLALVLSAFIAGLGGGLFAHFITSFTPKAFFLTETFVILAMLVIGGPATVSGAVIGTLLVTVIYQSLRWLENTLNIHQVFSGNVAGLTDTGLALILIAVLILRPGGFLERRELSLGGWLTRRKPAAPSALPQASATEKQEFP